MKGKTVHVTIDGFGGDKKLLWSSELVSRVLAQLPDEIGMTKISEPYMRPYDGGEKPEDGGVSGFVLIAESHITIHTFPVHAQVWVDVFSCKWFDAARVVRYIIDAFRLKDTKTHTLERGLEYPHSIPASIPLADYERHEAAAAISGRG